MAARKDNKGRALRKGEFQRASDGKYVYGYTDPNGERRYIYSKDLAKLREREKKLVKDQLDGLDVYVAGSADLNFLYDRYISTKSELRSTTYSNYTYMYDHYVRDGFGKKTGNKKGIRHALTLEQQRAFMGYIAQSPIFVGWLPFFTVAIV